MDFNFDIMKDYIGWLIASIFVIVALFQHIRGNDYQTEVYDLAKAAEQAEWKIRYYEAEESVFVTPPELENWIKLQKQQAENPTTKYQYYTNEE